MVAALGNAPSEDIANGFTDRPVSLTEYAATGAASRTRTASLLFTRQLRYHCANAA